ncbi:hypothetical protein SAMN05444170_5996 [Bradyrhizobium erythrophlei]|uniref:Uncharacterized protein n=1 Tax=Bradyrhizobium erythrophlei TaxID=1437360 RepID=A0A1M7UNY6_9BRAD|nr:hypothetical protein SAMN05444170_5996 [Bradyrhizobium erythrophlei]
MGQTYAAEKRGARKEARGTARQCDPQLGSFITPTEKR